MTSGSICILVAAFLNGGNLEAAIIDQRWSEFVPLYSLLYAFPSFPPYLVCRNNKMITLIFAYHI